MARTLILCPTHDHADALYMSIASVRAQRDTDWRMVVICDGSPQRTIDILEQISQEDPRVTYERHPKGERFGEAYRDPVIRNASEPYVCHLSDDDIWACDHLETMTAMLDRADFAFEASLLVFETQIPAWHICNHGTKPGRKMLPSGLNNIAYRRDMYLRLEEGWTPAPPKAPSDVYMWRKFFRHEDMRVACRARQTFLKLPSQDSRRIHANPERRLVDLGPWLAKVNQPETISQLLKRAGLGEMIARTFIAHEVQQVATFEAAMERCRLRAVHEDAPGNIAVDGEVMEVPLTSDQVWVARLVFLALKAGSPDATQPEKIRFVEAARNAVPRARAVAAVLERRAGDVGERVDDLLTRLEMRPDEFPPSRPPSRLSSASGRVGRIWSRLRRT
ncbi:glycosyltransferase family 2 protein [Jiella marina]|uniref:glycosyltransferase family 2 protein n=1 Tax=Jiella sp. LLJ827 TaxID=2917712 RepID=UPI0021018143|nr:glycosyltransferase family A protein [Jiella sp. LLJ827]MCQ0988014.1 glycosyltransferase family 2 protein [Jiella sp. LLJ827]